MKKNYFLTCLLIMIAGFSYSQTQFWNDDFEGASPSSGTRTPAFSVSCSGPPALAYFNRVGTAAISTGTVYTGFGGSSFWAIEDIDKGPTCVNNSVTAHQQINWTGINISGKSTLSFTGKFAVGTTTAFDGFGMVQSGGTSVFDYLIIQYQIDGGAWTDIIRFFPSINNAGNGTLRVETTGDSIAAGEGTALTTACQTLGGNIAGTGTTLNIRAKVWSNSAAEEILLDDFAVFEVVAAPEINIQGNSVSIVDGDATPTTTDHTDFGSQSICSGTIVRTFTVQNTGTSNLTVNTPTLSGTNAADFSITANPSSPVSASGSTTFNVTFNPSASGTRTATVTVTNGDSDEGTYDFAIQGTGIDPEVNVQGNGNSIADGDATPTTTDHSDFGSQSVCSGTIVRTFTIQNTGTSNLTLANPTLSGTNAADFSVTANPSTPVSAAGSTTFNVTFNPSASGTRTATVTFTNNDCDEATYDFAIQGTGIDPEVNVQGNGNSIADGDATPTSTDHSDFGSQSVCSGTIVRTFTIQNTGTSNLTLANPTLSGTNAADFSVNANPSTPVSAAGSTTFQVTFNPSASGTRSATVSFTSDDCDEATYDFAIQGTGIDPEVNVQGNGNSIADGDATPSVTDHSDFGSQDMCTGTIVRTFTIQNTGNSNLNLANPSLSGTNAADFSVTANPSTPVSAAGSTTFQVTFNPSAAGTRSATVSFTSDDCDEATYDFAIQGTGTDGTPNADAPSNVSACDSYTLPALSVGNYFTATAGGGTALSAGNNITSSQTIFVYAVNGSCSDENSFTITINTTPTADAPGNVTACDSYTLPALTVGNYFTGTGGTGTALSAGNNITSSQTIYVYAETGTTPNCTDENSFTVTINTTPTADAPGNVTACDSYTLPALTVGNYFTGTGGTGTALSAGNNITSSQTIYVYAETGTTPNCTDENSFTITINTTPTADAPGNVTACDSYTLPALTVGNYFTGTGGTGTALSAGNNITSSQTIYVYAETGTTPNCTDENSFTVTINTTPTADAPGNVTACDSYTLPALTVGNYFTGTGGTGTALSAGNNITSSQTIYVYAETGTTPNCTDENSFTVTINTTPTADAPSNVTACDTYTLTSLTVGNYFTGTGGTGTALSAGNSITSSQTIYVYAETGTTPNCTDENSFTVTINTTPTADAPSNVTACDSYTLPALTVGNYFTGTGGTGTALSAGNSITSSQTIYVYAETGTTPNCSDENSFVVTIEDCSQLTGGACGTTLTTLADAIYSDAVAGATNYRYWVQNASSGYSYVSVRGASDNLFRMSWLTSNTPKYGTTYTVRVSAYVAGAWQSYGSPCNITTPPTRLQPSSCGITIANMTDAIYCYPVVGATSYRFQVVHAGSSFNKIANSNVLNNNFFRMSWFTSDVLPGATYTVTVQAYSNGSWSAYGPSCTITTPSTLTKLATASCDISIPTLSTALYSDAVSGATNFRYEVVNVGAGFNKVSVRNASDNLFRLSWVTGIQLNTTYTIRVSAYLNGIWQAYGTACTVTTPAALMANEEVVLEHNNGLSLGEELVLETFPNPNTGSFTVSSNAAGRFKLTNEIGQLIQTLDITEENGFQTKVEGLGAGVYFVTGIVNETVLTKKIVVQ